MYLHVFIMHGLASTGIHHNMLEQLAPFNFAHMHYPCAMGQPQVTSRDVVIIYSHVLHTHNTNVIYAWFA